MIPTGSQYFFMYYNSIHQISHKVVFMSIVLTFNYYYHLIWNFTICSQSKGSTFFIGLTKYYIMMEKIKNQRSKIKKLPQYTYPTNKPFRCVSIATCTHFFLLQWKSHMHRLFSFLIVWYIYYTIACRLLHTSISQLWEQDSLRPWR